MLFAFNAADRDRLAELCQELRSEREDVLIAIDEEGGDVTRLETARGSSYPGNAALGEIDDLALTERVALAIGCNLRSVGININFAPVADVNVPMNPVIGTRSFGGEPGKVGRHVAAFVAALQRTGVAACAKHFPGHGATNQDSHLELPRIQDNVEPGLEPFKAAISAGTLGVMVGHLLTPGFGDAPASLNPSIYDLLRFQLSFQGVAFTDALEMKALTEHHTLEDAATAAIAAGADALCLGPTVSSVEANLIQTELERAVGDGRLSFERLSQAASRISMLRDWTIQRECEAPDVDARAGRSAAEQALYIVGDPRLPMPLVILDLIADDNEAVGEQQHSLSGLLADVFPSATVTTLRENDTPCVSPSPTVVLVRDAHQHRWMRELVADAPGAVVIEIGLPFWRPQNAKAFVATYGASRVSFDVLVERLVAELAAD